MGEHKPHSLSATARADAPDVAGLRAHLEANTGTKGLEIFQPSDVSHAAALFRRDGFVVIADARNSEHTVGLAQQPTRDMLKPWELHREPAP